MSAPATVSTMLPVNLMEYEAAARDLLPRAIFDFIAGGAADEVTLRENRLAFDRYRLLPRMLTGIDQPRLATKVLGAEIAMPVIVAPMGLHALAHTEGELATARAAKAAGITMSLGIAAGCAIEDFGEVAGAWWFQLYFCKDRGQALDCAHRAEAAGASALCLTVDVPVHGLREANRRNGFEIPMGMTMPNMLPVGFAGARPSYVELTAWDAAITWQDLEWLVTRVRLPVIVKGILAADDARLSADHGARAIVVSNHGGRQLDSAVASLDALPAIVDAAAESLEIYLDGGIRRGTDVLKALALGARAVMLGRPLLYGIAADGERGAAHVLSLLREELRVAAILSGVADLGAVPASLVVAAGPIPRA